MVSTQRMCGSIAALIALLPVASSAATMSLADAQVHIGSARLDELFLAFSSIGPGEHEEGDEAVADVLASASEAAMAAGDHHLAFAMAEIARRLAPQSASVTVAFALSALALELRGAAAQALDAALEQNPTDGDVLVLRARLAELEADLSVAGELYRKVPAAHPRAAEAREGRRRIVSAQREQSRTLEELARIEAGLLEQQERASKNLAEERRGRTPTGTPGTAPPPGVPSQPIGRATRDGPTPPPGMAQRDSRHFRIVYNSSDRDFGQRAEFEGRIIGLLENARERVGRLFDYHPQEPIEVVLYTAEEFRLHFGGKLGQNVLGFYAGKIRMNRAENPRCPRFRRTLVHEYVHAVVDQMAGGNDHLIPMWLNEGLAVWTEKAATGSSDFEELPAPHRRHIGQAAQAIPLSSLARTSFGSLGDPGAAYTKSRAAIDALVGTGGGLRKVLQVIERTGAGVSFEAAFANAFGERRLERLDEEANRILAQS